MSEMPVPSQNRGLAVPNAPVLVAGLTHSVWLEPSGEILLLSHDEAAMRVRSRPPVLCHAPATVRRIGGERIQAYDLLELFAFVRPAAFCLPTPRGLALAAGLPAPSGLEAEAEALHQTMRRLLLELRQAVEEEAALRPVLVRRLRMAALTMLRGGWLWGPAVLDALGQPADDRAVRPGAGLEAWEWLPEWSEYAPEPPPGTVPVQPAEARKRLAELLGADAEPRPQQADYASAVTAAFAPREQVGQPRFVLAEAGTGVGKTLGYVAPASLWAEKNAGAVWISTYTRNLQHQIDGELDRLYPDPAVKARKAVVRKGRENYLCLLNLEEASRGVAMRPQDAVALGLMARWTGETRDGDMVGGDFPGWLADLVGRGRSLALTDRRGECVYSACPHYHKCFIERSVRKARRAEIVVANHALVMVQAALGRALGEPDEGVALPTRYVFDEGHHVFAAADSAFAGHLSGQETAELRRWLLGHEGGRGRGWGASRARGLKRRIEELVAADDVAGAALEEALAAGRALPGEAWHQRVGEGTPNGPAEAFLAAVRRQVFARAQDTANPYSLEAVAKPVAEDVAVAARQLRAALDRLVQPLRLLVRQLKARLDKEADTLDSASRMRIEAVIRSLRRRAELDIGSWQAMLQALAAETPPEFVDWFAVERIDGRDIDVGMYRHWIDPTIPFAAAVAAPAHGIVVTSATLTDGSGDVESDWAAAEARTGAAHLPTPAIRAQVASPFDYAAQTRVFIVTDIAKDQVEQVAAAYRALFLAAGGGALGLFTAISRLRAVHARIAPAMEQAGLPCWRSMSTAWTPRRSSTSSGPRRTPACSAPTPCATASTCRAARCASSSSTGCRGRGRTSCTAPASCTSAARATTTC